ncbi:MAG: hypothetical protein N2745_06870 [Syntrophorhabdaceae bacterium]|nr:hypothetical protein [Syntrophorhabdaceae bacterium]
MEIVKYIEILRNNMKTLKKVLIAYLVALVLFDVLLPRDEAHAHYFVDKVWAYWTFFSIAGCFLLIKVAKGIAHTFLSKDEDYYG